MKPLLALLVAHCWAAGALAQAAETPTAIDALKLLPKGESKKLARIEARDGTPDPERWYLLTHDEKSENGLREFVIAAGEVVASRNLSQFVESVQPADVFGGEALKFDSDKVAKITQQYALANNASVAVMHYELRKDGPEAVPLWTVTCVDDAGAELGRIVVSAGKGSVISHDGFPVDPPSPLVTAAPPTPTPVPRPKVKPKTQATAVVAVEREPEIRRAEPLPPKEPEPKPGFLQRMSGSIQKALGGKGTEER